MPGLFFIHAIDKVLAVGKKPLIFEKKRYLAVVYKTSFIFFYKTREHYV